MSRDLWYFLKGFARCHQGERISLWTSSSTKSECCIWSTTSDWYDWRFNKENWSGYQLSQSLNWSEMVNLITRPKFFSPAHFFKERISLKMAKNLRGNHYQYEKGYENPFHADAPRRPAPIPFDDGIRMVYLIKVGIPNFRGDLNGEGFIDCLCTSKECLT